jgi:hypothetical protein
VKKNPKPVNAQKVQAFSIDAWKRDILLVELDYDPELICRLLRC